MKRILSLALSLFVVSSISACSTSQTPANPNNPGQTGTNQSNSAELSAKTDLFDTMLLVKDSNGVNAPVTPERIESLSVDGKAVATSSILLPGSAAAEGYKSEKNRLDAAAKVAAGTPLVIFGGNGTYSFMVPKSTQNNVVELKLKGDTQTYKLIRFNNLTRGTFVLNNGGIQGAFNTREAFAVKQATDIMTLLQQIFSSPASYYALASFDINAFVNYYQANGGQITVTTDNNQELTFEPTQPQAPSGTSTVTDAEEQTVQQAVETTVGADLSPLLGYIGTWTLENDLIKALVPGNTFDLEVAQTGQDSYRLRAILASGTYSGEGKHTGGTATSSTLNLNVSAGDKSLSVQFRLVDNNTLGVKLTQVNNVGELSSFVNTEVHLKRKL